MAQLIAKINSQSAAVGSLTATVDLEPSTGSVYSGFIKQYHDVKGFLLLRKPAFIRMTGQAPVVRTDIFDMASDGKQFKLYVPSENKFYVGDAGMAQKPGKTLENLRPQHILDALFLEPVDLKKGSYFIEEAEQGSERDYVVGEIEPSQSSQPGPVSLKRKIWFNRANLQISRVQLYGAGGQYQEDVEYSDYQNSGGVNYPRRIVIQRPEEDYSLAITLLNPQFNQTVPLSKFTLQKPANAILVNLSAPKQAGQAGEPRGQ
ncbi:MAG: LolA family protein [Terriglobia bacterium]